MGVHTNPKGSSQLLSRPGPGGHLEEVKTAPSSARRRDADGGGAAIASSLTLALDNGLLDSLPGVDDDDEENPNQLLMMIDNDRFRFADLPVAAVALAALSLSCYVYLYRDDGKK
jgi:hypothetical protein